MKTSAISFEDEKKLYRNLAHLYDKQVALGFDALTELIYDLFDLFKEEKFNVKWKIDKKELGYYGFYVNSAIRKLFVGMDYENWSSNACPFILSFESDEVLKGPTIEKIKKYATEIFSENIEFRKVNDLFNICIKKNYLTSLTDLNILYEQIKRLYITCS